MKPGRIVTAALAGMVKGSDQHKYMQRRYAEPGGEAVRL